MNILVVEPVVGRRAQLVDWTCELPGFVVVGAVPGYVEAVVHTVRTRIDVIVLGEVPLWDLSAITRLTDRYGKALVDGRGTMDEIAAELAAYRAGRRTSELEANARSANIRKLAFEGEAQHASMQTLQYRLRADQPVELAETIDLREWLPRTIARLRAVVPDHIQLVPMVAVDTAPVRCLVKLLEQHVYETALRACQHLPWGGTVWLTAAPDKNGEVTLEVLEDGRGEIRDVPLRMSAPAVS